MRKYLMIALAAFALYSCNKEREIVDCELQPKSLKYVFDVAEKPSFDGNTRAVKASWEVGDQIFIVYDDVDPSSLVAFMILTYDGEEWKVTQEPATNKPKDTGGTLSALYCEIPESSLLTYYDALVFEAEGNGQFMTGNEIPYTVEDGTLTASIALDFEKGDDMTYVQLRITDLPASTKGWTLEPDDYLREKENDFEVFLPAWLRGEEHQFSHLSLSDVAGPGYEYRLGNRDDGYYLYLSVQQKADDITFTITNLDDNKKYRKTFSRKISGKCAAITFKGPQLDADGTSTNGWKIVPLNGLTFADSAVEKICVENWDTNEDGYLSYTEAAAVTDLGTIFKDNTEITCFDELQFFTGLSSVGESAFSGCLNLTSIILPSQVTEIGSEALLQTSISSIVIPESVTVIGPAAFRENDALKSITIPKNVEVIGMGIISRCSNLETIVVDPENETFDSRNNCNAIITKKDFFDIFDGDEGVTVKQNTLLAGCCTTVIPEDVVVIRNGAFTGQIRLTGISIPDSVVELEGGVFYGCSGLESIQMGKGVEILGDAAFMFCSSLTSITLPESLIEMGFLAFQYCSKLESITIPEGITVIKLQSFASCTSLATVVLPASTESIQVMAFSGSNKISSFTVKAINPPTLGSSNLPTSDDLVIYVPAAAVNAYKVTEGWSSYADRIQAIP